MPKQPYINTFEDPALKKATVKEIKNTSPAVGDLKQVKTTSNLKNSKITKSVTEKSSVGNGVTPISNTDVDRVVTTPDGTVIVVTTDKDVYVNTFEEVTEQKYVSNYTNGGGGSLEVGTVVGTTYTSVVDGVNKLGFDTDSGFDVTDLGGGLAKIGMNSTFKFWQVDGSQGLVACGLDTVNFIQGCNISITADNSASPKTFTISSTAGTGVTDVNGITNSVCLAAGANISINAAGNTLSFCSTGGADLDGNCNFAVGNGLSNNTGFNNIAVGYSSLYCNTSGSNNIALGLNALCSNTTGNSNIGIGIDTLGKLSVGNDNVAIGKCVAPNLTSGAQNTIIGSNLNLADIGCCNIAIGQNNLYRGGISCNNIAIGNSNLYGRLSFTGCTTNPGTDNIAIGKNNLFRACGANGNLGLGSNTLYCTTTGSCNIAIGLCSLFCNTAGTCNVAIGINAGKNVDGSNNTIIGSLVGSSSLNDTVLIGAGNCERIKVDGTGLYINCEPFGGATLNQYCSFVVNSITGGIELSGAGNIAIGYCSQVLTDGSVSYGCGNISLGKCSLLNNTTGRQSIAIGEGAAQYGTTGFENISIGYLTGTNYSIRNISLGYNTGYANRGYGNTFIGINAAGYNCCGNENIAIGHYAGLYTNGANYSIFLGYNSGRSSNFLDTGYYNIAIGTESLASACLKTCNQIAIGTFALTSFKGDFSTYRPANIAIGYCTGATMTTGANNIFIGNCVLPALCNGCNNIVIGNSASTSMCFGNNNTIIGNSNTCFNIGCWNVCGNVFIAAGNCERIRVDNYGLYVNGVSLGSIIACCSPPSLTGYTPAYGNDLALGSSALCYYFGGRDSRCCNNNIAIGQLAMLEARSGCSPATYNIAIGTCSLQKAGSCEISANCFACTKCNIGIGYGSLQYHYSGGNNIAIGVCAGQYIFTGVNNTIIGNGLAGSGGLSDTILLAAGSCQRLKVDSGGLYINCSLLSTGDGLCSTSLGYRIYTPNSQSGNYILTSGDSGGLIIHPSTDANSRTFTIPANISVPYPVGTEIKFVNETSQAVTISINSDTLYLAGTGTTGSRTLAQYGVATAIKIGTTKWYISGTGLT